MDKLRIGLAQIAPVWLDRAATTDKILSWMEKAAVADCDLVVFGEGLLPGYPFWIEHTEGARFDAAFQKKMYAHYLDQGVDIGAGDLQAICDMARARNLAVYLGCIERGRHSLYCSLAYIDGAGVVRSVHRKLMPTYEERLVWAAGDGHGLRVHGLGRFTVGGLNCWENWMPLARTSLYAMGEDLHVAVWPGNVRNTEMITRFIARESRSYVVSVSGIFGREHIGDSLPEAGYLRERMPEVCANGGSCVAGPDGEWVAPPAEGREQLIVVEADHARVREERHNFDPAGHYARPDVLCLEVNRARQSSVKIIDNQ